MKSFVLKVLALLTIMFALYSCKPGECTHNHEVQKKDNFGITQDSLSCYPNSERPTLALTYREMADMFYEYDSGARRVLDQYMKKITNGKETRSTVYNWYKIDDLKQYIAYIERISKEKKIPVTGFRIYPTSYPQNHKDEVLRGRQTIILTPTTTMNGRDDAAFEPLYSGVNKPVGIQQFLNEARNKKVKKAMIFPFLQQEENRLSSSANRANTAPPY